MVTTSTSGSGPGRRGRPRSDWASWAQQLHEKRASSSVGDNRSQSDGFIVADFELFHHFVLKTADTLHDGSQKGLWREGAPRLGFQYPCLLDLILSLSSYHLARLNSADERRYLGHAERHFSAALPIATLMTSSLNQVNAPAVYVNSVLICFIMFAKGPGTSNLFVPEENGSVPWLHLIRGVRVVIKTTGWASIFSGTLAPCMPVTPDEPITNESQAESALSAKAQEDWRLSLSSVSDLSDVFSEARYKKVFNYELEVLTNCFEKTFRKGRHADPGASGRLEEVILWIYQVSDTYVQRLSEKDPVALMILGHFCALLSTVERQYWFLQGWSAHTMDTVLCESGKTRRWLSWPIDFLEKRRQSMN